VPLRLRGILCFFAMIAFTSLSLFARSNHVTPEPDGSASMEMRHGVPFVRVMVEGRGPFVFAVDTGTNNQAIVSPELAEKLRLPVVAQRNLTDLAGTNIQKVDEVALDSITLAGEDFHGVRAIVHSSMAGRGAYDGVLGIAFFRDVLLTLDFPHRRLEVSSASLLDDSRTIPMRFWQGVPAIFLQLGDVELEAQIDTGASALTLPASVASRQKFEDGIETLGRASTHVNSWPLRGGTLEGSIGMGGYVFQNPFVVVSERIPVANLGTSTLQKFVLQFDQRNRLLRLHTNSTELRLDRDTLQDGTTPPTGTAMISSQQIAGGY